jgi:hypothetical protein
VVSLVAEPRDASVAWEPLFRHREGDLAPVMVTLYRDNLGGLVLFMDEGDGAKVVGISLSDDLADDLAAAIHEHRTTVASGEGGERRG